MDDDGCWLMVWCEGSEMEADWDSPTLVGTEVCGFCSELVPVREGDLRVEGRNVRAPLLMPHRRVFTPKDVAGPDSRGPGHPGNPATG
jgi:hypothetical protein